MDYLKLLERSFEITSFGEKEEPGQRLCFLSKHIFDFLIDDKKMEVLFAKKALEVAVAVTEGCISEYIENQDDYRWFISLLNTPYFLFKLYWNSDVTEAVWYSDTERITVESDSLYDKAGNVLGPLELKTEEWLSFVNALTIFAGPDVAVN